MFFSWEDSVFYPCHQVCSLSDCQRSFFLKYFHSVNDRTLTLFCGSVKILSKLTETYSKEVWFKNKALVCHKVSGSNLFWEFVFWFRRWVWIKVSIIDNQVKGGMGVCRRSHLMISRPVREWCSTTCYQIFHHPPNIHRSKHPQIHTIKHQNNNKIKR